MMDMWSRFFHTRKKESSSKELSSEQSPEIDSPKSLTLVSEDSIRVLLFRECEKRGAKLLYDSQTVKKVPLNLMQDIPSLHNPVHSNIVTTAPTRGINLVADDAVKPSKSKSSQLNSRNSVSTSEAVMEITGGNAYQYHKQASDTKQLREMVFGSVALSYSGNSSKIHTMSNPPSYVLSRVQARAPPPHRNKSPGRRFVSMGCSMSDRMSSVDSSCSALEMGTSPTPCENDSGFGGALSYFSLGSGALLAPPSLPCNSYGSISSRNSSCGSSSSSLGNAQRRFLRRTTEKSLESLVFPEDIFGRSSSTSSTKLGFAIVIQANSKKKHEFDLCFQRSLNLLEDCVTRLQAALNAAYMRSSVFVSKAHTSIDKFKREVVTLMLNSMTIPSIVPTKKKEACMSLDSLCDSLHSTLSKYDIKDTNFFLSRLLTGVLTYHLDWASSFRANETLHPRDRLSFTENQLSRKKCRVAILGSHCKLVQDILNILIYLIRYRPLQERGVKTNPNLPSFSPNDCDKQRTPIKRSQCGSLFSHLGYSIECLTSSFYCKNSFVSRNSKKGTNSVSQSTNIVSFDVNNCPTYGEFSPLKDEYIKTIIPSSKNIKTITMNSVRRKSMLSSPSSPQDLTKRRESPKLYPSLMFLDDQKEIFNDFHPDVISAKVHTLYRVTPDRTTENPDNEMRVHCELVHPEVEDGKKVVFILGDDEETDDSKSNSVSSSKVSHDPRKKVEARHVTRDLPNYDSRDLPNYNSRDLPNYDSRDLPNYDSRDLPNYDSRDLPNYDSRDLPNNDSRDLPNNDSRDLPNNDSRDLPNHDSRDLPNHDSRDLPNHDSRDLPNHDSRDLPNHDSRDLPNHDSRDLPNHDSRDLPNHDSRHLPTDSFNMSYFSCFTPCSAESTERFQKNHRRASSDPAYKSDYHKRKDSLRASFRVNYSIREHTDKATQTSSWTDKSGKNVIKTCPLPQVEFEDHCELEKLPQGLISRVSDSYSPIYELQGVLVESNSSLEETKSKTEKPILSSKKEVMATVQRECYESDETVLMADTNDWGVWAVSSPMSLPVGMAPLVASLCDSLLQQMQVRTHHQMILESLELKLEEIYSKSVILADYLLGSSASGPLNLKDLPNALSVDLNDLPLLLATATTHSPQLADMYGLAIR